VLKIVDFGVSEMFDKEGEMKTAKSAGSPAFMPPELCVAKHGQVSGRAADIWSMGCTLYCLLFGRIPFEKHGMIELYQAIRLDEIEVDESINDELRELLLRLLEKDPKKRITLEEIRVSVRSWCFLDHANSCRNILGSHNMGRTLYYQSQRMSPSSSNRLLMKKSMLPLLVIWAI
jgi:serine/threonine protein kinase